MERRTGPLAVRIPVVAGMRQRCVADSEPVVEAEDACAVADLVQTLDSHET